MDCPELVFWISTNCDDKQETYQYKWPERTARGKHEHKHNGLYANRCEIADRICPIEWKPKFISIDKQV